MEEKKLNEKESLELITQMIRQSRKNIGTGSGNRFLLYGYLAVVLAVVVFALVSITGSSVWAAATKTSQSRLVSEKVASI